MNQSSFSAESASGPSTTIAGSTPDTGSQRTARAQSLRTANVSGLETTNLGYVAVDALILLVAFLSAFAMITIAGELHLVPELRLLFPSNLAWWCLYSGICILWFDSLGFYRPGLPVSTQQELTNITVVFVCVTLELVAVIYLSDVRGISMRVLVLGTLLNIGLFSAVRTLRRRHIQAGLVNGRVGRNALIIGTGDLGCDVAQYLDHNQQLGYRVTGFVSDEASHDGRILGRLADLETICRTAFVDEIFIATTLPTDFAREVFALARTERIDVTLVPDFSLWASGWMSVDRLGRLPTVSVHRETVPGGALFVKRVLDIIGSALGLVFLSPLFALLALLIKLDSAGSVFYCSKRVGRKGREFPFYKFRTMVSNADELKNELRHLNKRQGAFFKVENDPRITRVGRVLRRFSLDELPQLYNVLTGDMSLVGPRPHPIDDYRQYKTEHLRRLDVVPGITGLWQVTARRDPSFELNMALDMEYINNWSLWLDIKILARTIPAVFEGDGE